MQTPGLIFVGWMFGSLVAVVWDLWWRASCSVLVGDIKAWR